VRKRLALVLMLAGCTHAPPPTPEVELPAIFAAPPNAQRDTLIVRVLTRHHRLPPPDSHLWRLAATIREQVDTVNARTGDDVDPLMIAGIIHVESGGDSLAVSHVGAVGLGQIMPKVWGGVFPQCGEDLRSLETGVCYTINVWRYYRGRFPEQPRRALLAYNGCRPAWPCAHQYPRWVMNARASTLAAEASTSLP